MDANRFDALARFWSRSLPRRGAAIAAFGAGLGLLQPQLRPGDAEAGRKKQCGHGKKRCGKRCIPKSECCKDANCGTNERCAGGNCVSCLAQGTSCTDDGQCCTGICDAYTNRCQQVRVSCAHGESCPNGRCCPQFGQQCLYEKATQGPCEPETSCGYVVCGDKCSDLSDGTYQFCGFEGSAACRNGRCCCPKGVPFEDCPNIQAGTGSLPRCP